VTVKVKVEKYLKEAIIGTKPRIHFTLLSTNSRLEHAKVLYSDVYPIESTWAVVFMKKTRYEMPRAVLVVQPGTAGVVKHVELESSFLSGYSSYSLRLRSGGRRTTVDRKTPGGRNMRRCYLKMMLESPESKADGESFAIYCCESEC
jgi:hypothetical protein